MRNPNHQTRLMTEPLLAFEKRAERVEVWTERKNQLYRRRYRQLNRVSSVKYVNKNKRDKGVWGKLTAEHYAVTHKKPLRVR